MATYAPKTTFGLPHALGGYPPITFTAIPNNTSASVTLSVTTLYPLASTISITRTVASTGVTTAVRGLTAYPVASAGSYTYTDQECPLDTAVYYTITQSVTLGTATSNIITIVTDGSSYWLKTVGTNGVSLQVKIETMASVTRKARILANYPVLGKKNPILVTDVRGGREGSFVITTQLQSDTNALTSLLASGTTMLLQAPGAYGFPDLFFTAGDTTETWIATAGNNNRRYTIPFTEADSPADSITVAATVKWSNVLSFGTWGKVAAKRPTWNDLAQSIWTTADI